MQTDRPRDNLTSHDQAEIAQARAFATFGVALAVCVCVFACIAVLSVQDTRRHESTEREETKRAYYDAAACLGMPPLQPPTEIE